MCKVHTNPAFFSVSTVLDEEHNGVEVSVRNNSMCALSCNIFGVKGSIVQNILVL